MCQIEMSVMTVSFDKYADIWDAFVLCINRFWGDRTYKTYLVTNHAAPSYDGIEVVKTGDEVSWSRRVRIALETIQTEYIMLLLEDYLVSRPVDKSCVKKALEHMAQNNLDYLRIAPIPVIKSKNKNDFAAPITARNLYGVNLQAAIWRRDYLLAILGTEDFSAWQFEARQKFGEATRIEGNCQATREFVVPYLNGIIQGKWYPRTLEQMETLNIQIPLGNRPAMSKMEMRKFHFKTALTGWIPPSVIRATKPIAQKLGFKFVT